MKIRLRIILASLLAAALAGCQEEPTDVPDPNPDLGSQHALWQAARPDRYSYTFHRTCFCMHEWSGPFLVEAAENSVVRVRRVSRSMADPETTEVTEARQSYSIDSIFAMVEEGLARDNEHETVEYDSTYCFPAMADFDRSLLAQDDELTLQITEFRKE